MPETPPLERKLVAILAADIEGYSRLMHDDEDATLRTLTGHRTIIDEIIGASRGHVCGTAGDSLLAEFASVTDALSCAVAIQRALKRANAELRPERRMLLRIGINLGDVLVVEGDIFGDGVNLAARLEALAEPGGICVTRSVRDQIRDRMDLEFDDLGERLVKNIARPVRVFRVLFDADGAVETPCPVAAGTESATASVEADAVELAFWQSAAAANTPSDYLAYLQRWPEGAFAPLARNRLLARGSAPEDRSVELAFWESVRSSDEGAMFQAYLEKYPDGEFRSLAEIRLTALAARQAHAGAGPRPLGLIRAA